jgi:hypothetical protein
MVAKVYITQLPARREGNAWVPTVDVTPAREFGELIYLIPHGMNFPEAEMVEPQLVAGLANFKAEDYLLPMGDPVVMAAAGAVLGALRKPFKLLKWDRIAKRYQVYNLNPV